jgi:mediator of RNA polymerase II transcription subunit 7
MSSTEQTAAPITNTLFPPPPEYYKQYTDENVARYETLNPAEAGPSRSQSVQPTSPRAELSPGEKEELERLRGMLAPPRADWVREEGRWVTFGEMYTVSPLLAGTTTSMDWVVCQSGPLAVMHE